MSKKFFLTNKDGNKQRQYNKVEHEHDRNEVVFFRAYSGASGARRVETGGGSKTDKQR